MASRESEGLRNLVEMQQRSNRIHAELIEAKHRLGPLPPLTRWQRFRGTVRWKVDDLRQRVAERISPYGLDD